MTPQTWFTADTNFVHARIIALANRPFHDVREMDEALIRNWNDRVQPNDVVWHIGDFAFGNDAARLDEIFARLNGIKHLVPGNHDDDKDETLIRALGIDQSNRHHQCRQHNRRATTTR